MHTISQDVIKQYEWYTYMYMQMHESSMIIFALLAPSKIVSFYI